MSKDSLFFKKQVLFNSAIKNNIRQLNYATIFDFELGQSHGSFFITNLGGLCHLF